MKRNSILLLLVYLSLNARGSESENPLWFECDRDLDCVNIDFECAGGNVNKKFQKEAERFYAHQNSTRNCIAPVSSQPASPPPFRVFCKNRKCGSQGRNPKKGFS